MSPPAHTAGSAKGKQQAKKAPTPASAANEEKSLGTGFVRGIFNVFSGGRQPRVDGTDSVVNAPTTESSPDITPPSEAPIADAPPAVPPSNVGPPMPAWKPKKSMTLIPPLAAALGVKCLPVPDRGLKVAEMVAHKQQTWAIDIHHAVICLDSEYSSANGYVREMMDHATRIEFYVTSTARTVMCLMGMSITNFARDPKHKRPLIERAAIYTLGKHQHDMVTPTEEESIVYGPLDKIVAQLPDAYVTDNAARPPKFNRAEGQQEAEPVPNRPVHATTALAPPATTGLLVCTTTQVFHPRFSAQRVRVQFKRQLTDADRLARALELQADQRTLGVHMAGKDAIVVLNRSVTKSLIRSIRNHAGVFAARSQLPPIDDDLRIGNTPTQREVATIVPPSSAEEAKNWTHAFVTRTLGRPLDAAGWDVALAEISDALKIPLKRVGFCNSHACQVRIPRASAGDLEWLQAEHSNGEVDITREYIPK